MTLTILRIMLLRLWNSPLELVLIFIVPVVFFSVFATIFSHGIANSENMKVRIGIVDPNETELAQELIDTFKENAALRCNRIAAVQDEEAADEFVQSYPTMNKYDLLLRVLPDACEPSLSASPSIALITDGQNPMALSIVKSLVKGFFLQRAAQRKSPGFESGPPSPVDLARGSALSPIHSATTANASRPHDHENIIQLREIDEVLSKDLADVVPQVNELESGKMGILTDTDTDEGGDQSNSGSTTTAEAAHFVVLTPQSDNQPNPRVAMYAAGIAVLFLLFSATGNAATLLEERETGTLDRILASRAGLAHVLVGKWLGLFGLGCLQITAMFAWADLVFKISLMDHLPGFCIMTASTSAATSSFAIFLATLSKSRAQLSAFSVLIILSMSALGGSMIPRFAMSDRMKEIGQWTFNAWAIDGYQKVFWYQLPIKNSCYVSVR
jgi:ABC-2 type transport system permease protein